MNQTVTRILTLIFIFLVFTKEVQAQIYADITVGGQVSGTFTINLEYQKAPVAVANFIGLATGSNGWVDYQTGLVRFDPFYNGITFHRVIPGVMSQTGSRKGDGSDGPGYSFVNEIDPTLSSSSTLSFKYPYSVGMANNGSPGSNGSQLFITGTADSSLLNGSFTYFGEVISGKSICDALNSVATTGSSGFPPNQPLNPVTIQAITFRGPSLASFKLNPSGLPKISNPNPVITTTGTAYSLSALCEYKLFDSNDSNTWTNSWGNYFQTLPVSGSSNALQVTGSNQKNFLRMARVDYSLCYNHLIPGSLASKLLYFGPPLNGSLVVNSNQTAASWVDNNLNVSDLYYYNYSPAAGPYWASLYLEFPTGGYYMFDRLEYTSAAGGTFIAQTNYLGYPKVSGTFWSWP